MYMQIASLVKHWIQATAKPHVRKKLVTNLHTNKHIFPYLVWLFCGSCTLGTKCSSQNRTHYAIKGTHTHMPVHTILHTLHK